MSGFMPAQAVAALLEGGALKIVEEMPRFDFPVYVCWRQTYDEGTAAQVVSALHKQMGL